MGEPRVGFPKLNQEDRLGQLALLKGLLEQPLPGLMGTGPAGGALIPITELSVGVRRGTQGRDRPHQDALGRLGRQIWHALARRDSAHGIHGPTLP